MGLTSNLKINLFSKLTRQIFIKHYIRASSNYSVNRIVPATDEFVWDTSNPVKLRMENTAPGNYPPMLVQTMMRNTVAKHGSKTAIVSHDGQINWNYQEYYNQVQAVAKGFVSLDLTPMHGVGIMAQNHPYWQVSSIGSIFAGGISCGIYLTNSPLTVKYICEHAPLDLLVIQNQRMLDELLQNQPDIKDIVKSFVLMEDHVIDSKCSHKNVLTWQEMLESGKSVENAVLEQREENQAVNHACALSYTSGTTGPPKGAMISHDNVTWTSRIYVEHYERNHERILSFLPPSHIAGLMVDCYMAIHSADEIHMADPEALKGTLVDNLKRVRPTSFLGVPRVWEKVAEKIQESGKNNKGLKKIIGDWAKAAATKHHTMVREGKISHNQAHWSYKLAQKLIFSKIHEALGFDQIRNGVTLPGLHTVSAPMKLETLLYLQSLDMVIYDSFGSTESMGPTVSNMTGPLCKLGSSGLPFLGVTSKILNPDSDGIGEIATRSRNIFMGYHKDEMRTKEVFDSEGWYKSGDLGRIDQDGFYWVCGRIKELIITSGGENIAPIPIESQIKAELPELVSNVIVVGDQKKYLTCLISLKCKVDESGGPTNILEDDVIKFCNKISPQKSVRNIEEFKEDSKLNAVIQDGIQRANSKATANPHKIQKFSILPIDLSISGGELGPTLKVKRQYIFTKYANEISKMYE